MNQIKSIHNGKYSPYDLSNRLRGQGSLSKSIEQLFKISKLKHMGNSKMPEFDSSKFRVPSDQYSLF